jgi:hypothetical protein
MSFLVVLLDMLTHRFACGIPKASEFLFRAPLEDCDMKTESNLSNPVEVKAQSLFSILSREGVHSRFVSGETLPQDLSQLSYVCYFSGVSNDCLFQALCFLV